MTAAKRITLLCVLLATGGFQTLAWPYQDVPASSTSQSPTALDPAQESATIMVWGRPVAVLHGTLRGHDATNRARLANQRMASMIDSLDPGEITADWTESGSDGGVAIRAGNQNLFGILPGDVAGGDRASAEKEGQLVAENLRNILRERRIANRPLELLKSVALSVLATSILFVLCWLLARGNRVLQQRLARTAEKRLRLNVGGFDLRPAFQKLLQYLVNAVKWVLMLFLAYLWLSFVLRLFPYTRPWGERLGQYLFDLGARVVAAFIGQIPNLITLVVIFLITRGVIRLIKAWFQGIEAGTVHVTWLEAPVAGVTRRLFSVAIWLFALVVAYPYIPGAGTDAFKGVSVFLGLVLSLGSAGVVNQAVSGFVVLYSRAIRAGDFIRVGEHEGVVREMGTLSMKLLTRTREEVSVPNAVLSSTPVKNFTRQSREAGFLLTTSVTIGYDTPWRQVEALLELAAARTQGLLTAPRPFVLQTALSDYYVEYQLNVGLMNPLDRPGVLSTLHRNIQDAFNEFGVQIMSPHFHSQPDGKVWVPAEQWHESPAEREGP